MEREGWAIPTTDKGTEGKGKKKKNRINRVEKPVTDISVPQDSDYVSERRRPDQVTCPLLQKIRSKGFKGNWWWQFLHLYAMWHTRSKLLATFWTICQGRKVIIFFYILLLRTLSHLGVLPPAPCPPALFFYFSARIQTFTFDVIFLLHIRIAMPSFRKAIEYREWKGWHHFKHELLTKLSSRNLPCDFALCLLFYSSHAFAIIQIIARLVAVAEPSTTLKEKYFSLFLTAFVKKSVK